MESMKEELLEKAQNHDLNVEDIIDISNSRDPDVAIILQEIKEQLNWPNEAIDHDNGSITPPMGMWVDVACEYITSGYDGLLSIADNENKISFIVAFLQEYKTSESVNTLVQISDLYLSDSKSHKDTIIKIVSGLNLLLSFKGSPEIESSISFKARELVHKTLTLCEAQADYATAICALRGVGNDESIKLLSSIPKLEGSWAGTESIVKKAISKRLKNV